jgi:isopentenyl-diphosphate Delta-isomerase
MSRELELVELVDLDGLAVGSATVDEAHSAPGRLHRAFSVLLFDGDGRTLLQQRAAGKTRFPLRWANSCCGHPAPGMGVLTAARQRLSEELGVTGVPLREIGVYTYRAADSATGRVEHEYDHVVVGQVRHGLELAPDPTEVKDVRWAPASALSEVMRSASYAPWLSGVLPLALTAAPFE